MTLKTQSLVDQVEDTKREGNVLAVYFKNGHVVGYQSEKVPVSKQEILKYTRTDCGTSRYILNYEVPEEREKIVYALFRHYGVMAQDARDVATQEASTFSQEALAFFNSAGRDSKKQKEYAEMYEALRDEYRTLVSRIEIKERQKLLSGRWYRKVTNPGVFQRQPTGSDAAVIFEHNPKANIQDLYSWQDPYFVFPDGLQLMPPPVHTEKARQGFGRFERAKYMYKQAQYFLPIDEKQKKLSITCMVRLT